VQAGDGYFTALSEGAVAKARDRFHRHGGFLEATGKMGSGGLCEVGGGCAGTEGCDGDACPGNFLGERFGEREDIGFSRVVDCHARPRLKPSG